MSLSNTLTLPMRPSGKPLTTAVICQQFPTPYSPPPLLESETQERDQPAVEPPPPPPPRALDTSAKPAETRCFSLAHYAVAPHHHLLNCGHSIVTVQREPCGANCALQQSAGNVPGRPGFRCPNAECASRLEARVAKGLRSVSKASELRECEESLAQGDLEEAREVRRHEVARMGVSALGLNYGAAQEEDAM